MSFLLNDSATVAHTLNTETLPDGSQEMFSHGSKAVKQGGAVPYRNLDVGITGVSVTVDATQLYGGNVWNNHASAIRYLKIYDLATAPTSSDEPKWTIPLKAQQATDLSELVGPVGTAFALGLGLRATTLLADTDATAPSANDVVVNLACSSRGGFVAGVVTDCPMAGGVPVVTG